MPRHQGWLVPRRGSGAADVEASGCSTRGPPCGCWAAPRAGPVLRLLPLLRRLPYSRGEMRIQGRARGLLWCGVAQGGWRVLGLSLGAGVLVATAGLRLLEWKWCCDLRGQGYFCVVGCSGSRLYPPPPQALRVVAAHVDGAHQHTPAVGAAPASTLVACTSRGRPPGVYRDARQAQCGVGWADVLAAGGGGCHDYA